MKLTESIKKLFTVADNKVVNTVKEQDIEIPELKTYEDTIESDLVDLKTRYFDINFDAKYSNIKELIKIYRDVAANHEVEIAIDEIENDAITIEERSNTLEIDFEDDIDFSEQVLKNIRIEFDNVLKAINYKRKAQEYFRQWYIDGRLYFEIVFFKNFKKGISRIKKLSPFNLQRKKDKDTGEYIFIYSPSKENKTKSIEFSNIETDYIISSKNILFVPSGLTDPENSYYISHLHKAIKPLNQLKALEDSAVIYHITRAPERRVFYIDVGKLPPKKANAYVQEQINEFQSGLTYDQITGKVIETKNTTSMLEDYYLPTSSDQKGTKIETLAGGTNISGFIENINYFKRKLLKSLKVPFSRVDAELNPVVDFGRTNEMTRSELSFYKFIKRLRNDFSCLILELLKIQLIIKNIITIDEWAELEDKLILIWPTDNYYEELKNNDVLTGRLEILGNINEHVGKYFSKQWIRKNILKLTDDEIKIMQEEIDEEKKESPEEDEFA